MKYWIYRYLRADQEEIDMGPYPTEGASEKARTRHASFGAPTTPSVEIDGNDLLYAGPECERVTARELDARRMEELLEQIRDLVDKEIAEQEADPRFGYKSANVVINAPLALQQVAMKATHGAMLRVRAILTGEVKL